MQKRHIVLGLCIFLVVSRWVPLFLVLVLSIVAVITLLLGCILAISFLYRKSFNSPLQRDLPRLKLVSHWNEVLALREKEKVPFPKRPPAQTQSIKIRMENIIALMSRDYLKSWYLGISKEEVFLSMLDLSMRHMLHEFKSRMEKIDFPTLLVGRMIPIFTTHLHDHRAAVVDVRYKHMKASMDADVTESEELDKLYVQFYRKGRLHRALTKSGSSSTELKYLRQIAYVILKLVAPPKESTSKAATLMLREIIVCKILHPTLTMLADPDYINQWLDYFATRELVNQGVAKKFRESLDSFFSSGKSDLPVNDTAFSKIRSFDEFLKQIQECNNLLDAKRYRHQIIREMKKNESRLGEKGQSEPLPPAQKLEIKRYINRLGIAKKRCEKKIIELGGDISKSTTHTWKELSREQELKKKLTAEKVIRSNTSLFYFMEFMERNSGMVQVQFLLMIEGFRKLISGKDQEIVKRDAQGLYESYLYQNSPLSHHISKETIQTIEIEIHKEPGIENNWDCIFKAQQEIFHVVNQEFFPKFLESDLFYRLSVDPAFLAESKELLSTNDNLTLPRSSSVQEDLDYLIGSPPSASSELILTNEFARNSPDSKTNPFYFDAEEEELEEKKRLEKEKEENGTDNEIDDKDKESKDRETHEKEHLEDLGDLKSEQEIQEELEKSATVAAVEEAFQSVIQESGTTEIQNLPVIVPEKERNSFVYDGSAQQDPEEDLDFAPPGDLLTRKSTLHEINDEIDRIRQKEAVIETLIKKTTKKKGKEHEVRILQMSKSALQKELQELLFRKGKLENQESKDILTPGLCTIQISASTIGYENGKPFAMYVIEVHRSDPLNPSGWVVARRYREFYDLHNKLKVKFPIVNDFELPGKKMTFWKLKKEFVEERRIALQHYLQLLLDNKDICQSEDLREFLCQKEQKYNIPKGVDHEFGDITQEPQETSLFPKYVQQVSTLSKEAFQGLTTPFSEVLNDIFSPQTNLATINSDLEKIQQNQQKELEDPQPSTKVQVENPYDGGSHQDETTYKPEAFTNLSEPLCNLIIELFSMKERSSYLRRQAVILILQQILGGTIERKVIENVDWLISEEMLAYYLEKFLQTWWPDNVLVQSWPPRTLEQKDQTKAQAKQKLLTLLPEFFSSIIGADNSRRGGVRLFDAFQSAPLNKHLMYTLFDEMIGALFPEFGKLNDELQKQKSKE